MRMKPSPITSNTTHQKNVRLIGFDIARAFAFIGMVIVNFNVVMTVDSDAATLLYRFAALFEGRAVATFILLAGVGITLLSRRAVASGDPQQIASTRRTLWKRSLFLLAFGLLFAIIWPADILHFYALYIAFAAFFIAATNRTLWIAASAITLASPLLMVLFNYEAGWNWDTLDYVDFWTPVGMFRHLVFNGFHPFFPWASFLLIGLWLGRQDLRDKAYRRRLLTVSLGIALLVEMLSLILTNVLDGDWVYFVDTAPLPPTPWYIVAASATAFVVITLTFELVEWLGDHPFITAMTSAGQIALTLYVAHVVLGLGVLDEFGRMQNQPITFTLTTVAVFSALSIIFAHLWRKRFKRGPFEALMRRLSSW